MRTRPSIKRRGFFSLRIQLIVAATVALAVLLLATGVPGSAPGSVARANGPIPGSLANARCPNIILDFFGIELKDLSDEGWAWVEAGAKGNPELRFREITGTVVDIGDAAGSHIATKDFPINHDSHDLNALVLVDPGQEDRLSDVGLDFPGDPRSPDTMKVEWEIGTFPTEADSDPERTFPKWVWPSVGDRVWAEGHWVFDCGHSVTEPVIGAVKKRKTEIHPARAFASMRDQVRTLPGTGTAPVPVTATDLYIHGQAGPVTDVLECGLQIVIGEPGEGGCDFAPEPHRGTPIDVDFEFDIPLPLKPSPSAILATFVEVGPENTVGIAPVLTGNPKGAPTSVHVKIPLAGSGVEPDDVYARRIYAGWLFPSANVRHFRLTLDKMDLHEDMELDPGNCACTFFWMNVDRALRPSTASAGPEDEWIRLSTFATGDMHDYDDDFGPGNGEMEFSGATFDFFVRDGQPFTVRAHGYEQDCADSRYGNHTQSFKQYIFACYIPGTGQNDKFNELEATFGPPDYGVGPPQDVTAGGEYELEFTIEEIPVTLEADLKITAFDCTPPAEIPVAEDVDINCSKTLRNDGPTLALAEVTKTASASPDCTVTPTSASEDVLLLANDSVELVEQFTIRCTKPSIHGFAVENEISVKGDDVVDPDPTNNTAGAAFAVPVIAQADLAIKAWDFALPPALLGLADLELDVSEPLVFTTTKVVHNFGPFAPVDANVWKTMVIPAGLEGSVHIGDDEAPATIVIERPDGTEEVLEDQPASTVVKVEGPATLNVHFMVLGLDESEDRTIVEEFDVHCLKPGFHVIRFTNEIAARDEHTSDPDPDNNESVRDLKVLCLNHFLGYRIKMVTPMFEMREVTLADQFVTGKFLLERPDMLYTPADKEILPEQADHANVSGLETHLMSYKLEHVEGGPEDVKVKSILVTNQFGEFVVEAIGPDHLLVPTTKALLAEDPPGQPTEKVDHFLCYKVEEVQFRERVSIADQFGTTDYEVKNGKWLCNPVEKRVVEEDGSITITPIQNPGLHLMCFDVKPREKQNAEVNTNNQFGRERLVVDKQRELCVPSEKILVPAP